MAYCFLFPPAGGLLIVSCLLLPTKDNFMSKKYLSLFAILVLALALTGCGKKTVQEKMAEKILEQSADGQADVDIADKKVKVETQEGTMEAGQGVSLPSDFPSDVYVIDGQLNAAYQDVQHHGFTISLKTSKSTSEVQSVYEQKLKDQAWKITGIMSLGTGASLSAEKDNRVVSVIISSDGNDGQTGVILGVSEK